MNEELHVIKEYSRDRAASFLSGGGGGAKLDEIFFGGECLGIFT